MNITIIGAGGMGCLYGAYLSKNNNVVMINSSKNQVDSINQNGITISEADGKRYNYKNVKAYLSGEYEEKSDIVIVFVKATQTEAAVRQNIKLFYKDTTVITLQNGMGNDEIIKSVTGINNIIIGTSRHNAINLGNAQICHPFEGTTVIGSTGLNNMLEKIRDTFCECGLNTEISDDIRRIIWSKLFLNISINPFTFIAQTFTGFVTEDEHARSFAKMLIDEAISVAKADGLEFEKEEVYSSVRLLCSNAKNGYSSMYQDRQKKIKTEIDALNGAVVKKAEEYGMKAPCNELVVKLVHAIEDSY